MLFRTCPNSSKHSLVRREHRWCVPTSAGCGEIAAESVCDGGRKRPPFASDAGQVQGEPLACVEPSAFKPESGRFEHVVHHGKRVLITVFRVNPLSTRESHLHIQQADTGGLRSQAFQKDLHARSHRVPLGDVLEAVKLEVRAEFTIDPPQDVLVKPLSDTLRIIVGSDKQVFPFDQVSAKQKGVAWCQLCSNLGEHGDRFGWIEIADARSEIQNQLPAWNVTEKGETFAEISDYGPNRYMRALRFDSLTRLRQRRRRDIYRKEVDSDLPARERLQQSQCLLRCAGAQFYDGESGADNMGHFSGVIAEDGEFDA